MNEDIKEIEQYLKKCSNCFTCNNFLREDENGGHCMLQNAYNYITNLQEDLDKANEIIEKDRQFYKGRIEENAELRKEIEEYRQLIKMQNEREYRSKFLKDFQKEHGKNVLPDYDEIYKRYDDYKQRNEKAIEYIEKNKGVDDYGKWVIEDDKIQLLDILKGVDEE